jgi:hypothetical protein
VCNFTSKAIIQVTGIVLMHVRELVELGALVAAQGSVSIRPSDDLLERHVEDYWLASRCRLDRWGIAIKNFSTLTQTTTPEEVWDDVRPTIEEILVSELLTRTWSAVACASDQLRGTGQLEPIVRSVMGGHLEARNRALSLLVFGRGLDVEQAVSLNRLRKRTERWTDMLLGHLLPAFDVAEFAFDASRSSDFASDLEHENKHTPPAQTWNLILASLRAAFQHGLSDCSPNADLNERIAAGVLACFRSELFDSSPLAKSLWLARMTQTADDAQDLIDNLVELEKSTDQ